MGKTTLCDKYGYTDDDMYDIKRPPIKEGSVVLTNEPPDDCDAYFLPPNYENAFAKLSPDKQKFFNEYKDLLKTQYENVQRHYEPIMKDYITHKDITTVIKRKVRNT